MVNLVNFVNFPESEIFVHFVSFLKFVNSVDFLEYVGNIDFIIVVDFADLVNFVNIVDFLKIYSIVSIPNLQSYLLVHFLYQDNYWEPGQSKAYHDFFFDGMKNTGYVPIIIRPGVDTGRKKQEAFDNTVSLNRILGDTRLVYKSDWKEVKIKLQVSLTKDQIVMAQNSMKTLQELREIDADRGKKGHHYPSHEERNQCAKEARQAKRTRENSIICPRDDTEKCGTFTAESSLYKHLMSQHYHGAEFRCFLCSQLFTRQVTLEYHLMVHFNIVVEDCRVCGFVNRHVNHYNVHYR